MSYGYDATGNATRVANPTATWTYAYNKRNLPETEQAVIDGHTYLIDPTYNPLGQRAKPDLSRHAEHCLQPQCFW